MIAAVRTAAAVLFLAGFIPLAAIIGFPWTFISGNADVLYSIAMVGARAALRLAGIKVVTEGREQLDPRQGYIFMCNHVSNVDPPVVIPALPGRTSVLVKKELFRVPILGRAMRLASLVPVDRSNRQAAIESIGRAAEVLKSGIHMTVFPEGTRSRDGRLLPFKKGPFHLAMDSGVAIVPVTVLDTFQMMPKGSPFIQGGKARLAFHPPIDPKNFSVREELMEAVRQSIASALPENLR
jgi:1-acyl-sn-glycerol-3-phosphate acyltransferase